MKYTKREQRWFAKYQTALFELCNKRVIIDWDEANYFHFQDQTPEEAAQNSFELLKIKQE